MRTPPKPYDPDDEADLIRALNDSPKSFPFNWTEFHNWAQTVEEDAKIICKDPKGEKVRFVITNESGLFTIDMGKVNASTLDCIIRGISQDHSRMPYNIGTWYLILLNYLKIQEKKLQTQKEREE